MMQRTSEAWNSHEASMMIRERRGHRRHDLETLQLPVDHCLEGGRELLGTLVDLSAGGVRIRAHQHDLHVGQSVRIRLSLPVFAGVCPFLGRNGKGIEPRHEWTGWITIQRLNPSGAGMVDVGGQLSDMDEMDRGMLGLYLSTQPMAA